jgi:hypothetical protein
MSEYFSVVVYCPHGMVVKERASIIGGTIYLPKDDCLHARLEAENEVNRYNQEMAALGRHVVSDFHSHDLKVHSELPWHRHFMPGGPPFPRSS